MNESQHDTNRLGCFAASRVLDWNACPTHRVQDPIDDDVSNRVARPAPRRTNDREGIVQISFKLLKARDGGRRHERRFSFDVYRLQLHQRLAERSNVAELFVARAIRSRREVTCRVRSPRIGSRRRRSSAASRAAIVSIAMLPRKHIDAAARKSRRRERCYARNSRKQSTPQSSSVDLYVLSDDNCPRPNVRTKPAHGD